MHDAREKRRPQLEIAGREEPRRDVRFDADDFEVETQRPDAFDISETNPTSGGGAAGACPHVDRNDARCSHRFSLGRIEQAFNVCFGTFHGCPLYHRIGGEIAEISSEQRIQPLVEIRVIAGAAARSPQRDDRGQVGPVGVVAGLRKTGT